MPAEADTGGGGKTEEEDAREGKEEPTYSPEGPLFALLDSNPTLPDYITGLFSRGDVIRGVLLDWQTPMLSFVRWAKSHPDMAAQAATGAWGLVASVVKRWKGAGPDYWWSRHFGVTEEDAEVQFLHWWTRVRSLPTADPLEYALALADECPLRLRAEVAARARSKNYPRFVGLCGYLQRNVGSRRPIFFDGARAGELLGVTKMSVSRYCGWAVEDAYLVKVRESSPGRCAEYKFDLSRFAHLTEGQT